MYLGRNPWITMVTRGNLWKPVGNTAPLPIWVRCSRVRVWVRQNIPTGYPCHTLDPLGGPRSTASAELGDSVVEFRIPCACHVYFSPAHFAPSSFFGLTISPPPLFCRVSALACSVTVPFSLLVLASVWGYHRMCCRSAGFRLRIEIVLTPFLAL
jgi:hypothetical protein